MKITELLKKESIFLNADVKDKDETIDTLIDLLYRGKRIDDKDLYKEGIYAREALTTTGIGEGIAIPFAAKDQIRIIPSCIVRSAIAGGLSMLFGCTLRAPHGGVFVLPTIGNPLMYALAILIGATVGGFMLSLLKKPLDKEQ